MRNCYLRMGRTFSFFPCLPCPAYATGVNLSGENNSMSTAGMSPDNRSASISPSTGANLKPCPASPTPNTCFAPGISPRKKCPSGVNVYKHISDVTGQPSRHGKYCEITDLIFSSSPGDTSRTGLAGSQSSSPLWNAILIRESGTITGIA